MNAMHKETLTIDAIIMCPECMKKSELRVSRKSGMATLECPDCGILEDEVIKYGAGLKVGGFDE